MAANNFRQIHENSHLQKVNKNFSLKTQFSSVNIYFRETLTSKLVNAPWIDLHRHSNNKHLVNFNDFCLGNVNMKAWAT